MVVDPAFVVAAVALGFAAGVASVVVHPGHGATTRARRRSDGSQEVRVVVHHGYHPDRIELTAGVPATIRFQRREDDPCSEVLVSELFPSEYHLAPNAETVVRFTPASAGTFAFTCGLGMFSGRIVVRPLERGAAATGLGLLLLAAAATTLSACAGVAAAPVIGVGTEPTAPAAAAASMDLGERRSEAGAVTIVASWTSTDPPALSIKMDTHSVDLDAIDLSRTASVRSDGGEWVAASGFVAPKGGHHRAGTLTFAALPPASLAAARLIELRIVDVAAPERLLRWERTP